MPAAHVLVTVQNKQSDVPADFSSHSLYFLTNGSPGPSDWQALTDHVQAVIFSKTGFGGPNPWTAYGGRGGTVKAYDLADPKPRPIKATTVYTPTTWNTITFGPRHVATCLSYYAQRNLPHSRGRIYVGPINSSDLTEVPGNAFMQTVQDLAHGLYQISTQGTLSWMHSVHSTVTNNTQVVTNYWTNNVWDVQHSREHVETVRLLYP